MALKTIKLDQNGDPVLDVYARPVWLKGQQAAEQIIGNTLRMRKGDWAFDTARGVDREKIVKRPANRQEAISVLASAVSKISFVNRVIDMPLEVDAENRIANVSAQVEVDRKTVVE